MLTLVSVELMFLRDLLSWIMYTIYDSLTGHENYESIRYFILYKIVLLFYYIIL